MPEHDSNRWPGSPLPVITSIVMIGKACQLSGKAAKPLAAFIPQDGIAIFANVIGGVVLASTCVREDGARLP